MLARKKGFFSPPKKRRRLISHVAEEAPRRSMCQLIPSSPGYGRLDYHYPLVACISVGTGCRDTVGDAPVIFSLVEGWLVGACTRTAPLLINVVLAARLLRVGRGGVWRSLIGSCRWWDYAEFGGTRRGYYKILMGRLKFGRVKRLAGFVSKGVVIEERISRKNRWFFRRL